MRQSLYNNALVKPSLTIAVRTNGTANGTGVDLTDPTVAVDNFRSAMAVIHTGTLTDGSVAFKLQDSPDNSAWTDVAGSDLQGANPTAGLSDDDKVYELGYQGSKRYLRVVATTTGATSGGTFGASIVMAFPRRPPVQRS